jgi:integrase
MSEMLLDRAGRGSSPATMPGFQAGRPPRNKGLRYPADPPKVEGIIAVMRTAGDAPHGRRLRGLIVVLWRAGLRVQEALALVEADLDYGRGALLVRRGKGGRRREVGMDTWGWDELQPWLDLRVGLPVGPLFCVLNGRTRGRQWSSAAARADLRRTAVAAGVRRRFAPHQLRHAHGHTFASLMIAAGVNAKALSTFMGHASVTMTLDRYGHLFRGSEEEAAGLLAPTSSDRPRRPADDRAARALQCAADSWPSSGSGGADWGSSQPAAGQPEMPA